MKGIKKSAVVILLLAAIGISCLSPAFAATAAADFTVGDYQSLVKTVERQMVGRDTYFTVRYNAARSSLDSVTSTLMNDVLAYDDPATTSDLDYLLWNLAKWHITGTIYTSGTATYGIYTFSPTYRTTASQESYVNSAVGNALKTLDVSAAGTYIKIKAVHDYILKNVDYDNTLSRYTAYDALSSGRAVCQGYTLLMYKMLLDLGVPVKFISGTTTKSSAGHAWNIVKIGQLWYNVDATWDDSGSPERYFLRGGASFSDHIRDGEYTTAAFNASYPMSSGDYDPNIPSDWAGAEINALAARGVVPASLLSEYQTGITRAEFTALIVSVYEYVRGPHSLQSTPPFNDVAGSPYVSQISKGYDLDIVSGTSATTFNPDGTLTREQCAKIISAAAGAVTGLPVTSSAYLPFADTGKIDSWAMDYVRYAYEHGLMSGTGVNFDPLVTLTREQAMVIAERLIEKYNW